MAGNTQRSHVHSVAQGSVGEAPRISLTFRVIRPTDEDEVLEWDPPEMVAFEDEVLEWFPDGFGHDVEGDTGPLLASLEANTKFNAVQNAHECQKLNMSLDAKAESNAADKFSWGELIATLLKIACFLCVVLAGGFGAMCIDIVGGVTGIIEVVSPIACVVGLAFILSRRPWMLIAGAMSLLAAPADSCHIGSSEVGWRNNEAVD